MESSSDLSGLQVENRKKQLVVPQNTSKTILKQLHDDMGHQGIERTTQLARERYHWLDMTADILAYCKHCRRCNTAKAQIPADRAPLQLILATRPLEIVAMDFTVMEPAQDGRVECSSPHGYVYKVHSCSSHKKPDGRDHS